jgi:hypothetical protein
MKRTPRTEEFSALGTEEYFAGRAKKGDVKKALRLLRRAGRGKPPVRGDEIVPKVSRLRR